MADIFEMRANTARQREQDYRIKWIVENDDRWLQYAANQGAVAESNLKRAERCRQIAQEHQ